MNDWLDWFDPLLWALVIIAPFAGAWTATLGHQGCGGTCEQGRKPCNCKGNKS